MCFDGCWSELFRVVTNDGTALRPHELILSDCVCDLTDLKYVYCHD